MDPIYNATKQNAAAVSIPGSPTLPIAFVHKDDLGEFYIKVVDRLTILAAPRTLKAIGYKGQVNSRPAENPFEEGMITVTNFRPNRARGLLGWEPRQIPFTQGMEIYAAAYKAFKE
ncbi:hypothetical protein FRB95_006934 [Tulasnella sp. JGI-2019a]|nr:hypothetical protein FRB95_006934 [Tulasnella sp. JGI-2019a]